MINKRNLRLKAGLMAFLVSGATLTACRDNYIVAKPGEDVAIVTEDNVNTTVGSEVGEPAYDVFTDITTLEDTTLLETTTLKGETTTKEDTTAKSEITAKEDTTINSDTTLKEDTTSHKGETTRVNVTTADTTRKPSTTKATTTKKDSTTKATTSKTTKVTTKTTTSKTTTKTTTTTTKTTTQPTTTTTTTTEVTTTTQAPSGYTLQDICTNWAAFNVYSGDLNLDMMHVDGYAFSMINLSYGQTAGGLESFFVLAALNADKIYDEPLSVLYSECPEEYLIYSKEFICNFKYIEYTFGKDVDYSKYTVDPDIGNFLNQADDAYRNGYFDQFMTDKIINGNVDSKITSNPGVMAILCSYDDSKRYLNRNDIDNNYLDSLVNRISQLAYGHGYSK